MSAYYNEFDPGAAAWLRELIKEGHIADGEVDTRSIIDVRPADLAGFTQCHFFAGIGGWSYALRLAGWSDDRPVWTGSPPCQPFSAAGKQASRDDARHLAPHFISLVGAARPAVLFGEQVASSEVFGKAAGGAGKRADGPPAWAWIDDLSDRLEAARYAVGASDFPSAGVGAPHIRQRTFFGAVRLADADGRDAGAERQQRGREQRQQPQDGGIGRLADSTGSGRREERADSRGGAFGNCPEGIAAGLGAGRSDCGMADADSAGRLPGAQRGIHRGQESAGARDGEPQRSGAAGGEPAASPLHGFWSDADWLFCRDGKWRPVEPGTFPLAHGVSGRVGLLRGYGNAINPHAAAQFIQAFDGVISQ